jgi:hypothetical protein
LTCWAYVRRKDTCLQISVFVITRYHNIEERSPTVGVSDGLSGAGSSRATEKACILMRQHVYDCSVRTYATSDVKTNSSQFILHRGICETLMQLIWRVCVAEPRQYLLSGQS